MFCLRLFIKKCFLDFIQASSKVNIYLMFYLSYCGFHKLIRSNLYLMFKEIVLSPLLS